MEKQKKEITFAHLYKVLKKSLLIMLISAVIVGALGALYTAFVVKPTYKATSSFWVNNTTAGADYTSQAQTAAASVIAASCIELSTHEKLARTAVEKYQLTEKLGMENDNQTVNYVKNSISAYKLNEDTLLFYISVTTADKEATYTIMNAVKDVVPEVVEELNSFKFDVEDKRGDFISLTDYPYSIDSVQTIKTSPVKIALILAVVAAIVVYIIYFVISLLDSSVYGEETIKENFEQPLIGTIPSWRSGDDNERTSKRKKGDTFIRRNYTNKLIGADTPFFVTEAFNALRTNVVYSAAGAKNPIFAVTSDVAGAGKTVTGANLAIAIANLGKKVLLVEGDMRCPAFSDLFHMRKESGFSELLAGIENNTADVVEHYGDTTLDILFCGKIPPNPSELLSGFRMAELADEWRSTYDYIILDMPPIGEVTDAGVVASVVNGYILTVRCNHSNVKDATNAAERIASVDGNVVGIVLNDLDPKSVKGSKYYKKHGYYGDYQRTEDKSAQ